MEFKFVVDREADNETLRIFHKRLANGLINKFGRETCEEILRMIKEENKIEYFKNMQSNQTTTWSGCIKE